jgi:hypothetical protein
MGVHVQLGVVAGIEEFGALYRQRSSPSSQPFYLGTLMTIGSIARAEPSRLAPTARESFMVRE